jgi:hypothetical protein
MRTAAQGIIWRLYEISGASRLSWRVPAMASGVSNWQPRPARSCHKFATGRDRAAQRIADFCGLERNAILW